MLKKEFTVQAHWKAGDFENAKTHRVHLEEKESIVVSAAKQFKGDGARLNPEDLFLSALASCHMMSYMYVCSKHGITVLDYSDRTTGTLTLNADGSGGFQLVELHPVVTIAEADKQQEALDLHKEANRLCFIANSSKTEIRHFPEILLKP